MEIHGREINFLRTTLAACEIGDMCPDGDISKIGALFSGKSSVVTKNMAWIMVHLNNGYEMSKHFEDTDYEMHPVSFDELMCLDHDVFTALFEEATEVHFFVGRAMNPAHQNPAMSLDLSIKLQIVERIASNLRALGRNVTVEYY